jgi:hypothetical protein
MNLTFLLSPNPPENGHVHKRDRYAQQLMYNSFPVVRARTTDAEQIFMLQPRFLLVQQVQVIETLLLSTLLLGRHDLETAIVQLILGLLLGHRGILLGDFAPASRLGSCGGGRAGGLGTIHQSLVGELASADEFFGKVARVDRVRDAVHGFGDNLQLGREREEVVDEFVGCGFC